jgi:two-component system chemotaxis response regulator CheY
MDHRLVGSALEGNDRWRDSQSSTEGADSLDMGSTVLVVDDSAMIRRRVKELLVGAGYEVLEAGDGWEGHEAVTAHPGLSLIIADINMPRMSGLEMLKAIRAEANNVPVLMLTTEGNAQVMLNARAAGAAAWLIKPFKNEHLLESVKKIAAPTA